MPPTRGRLHGHSAILSSVLKLEDSILGFVGGGGDQRLEPECSVFPNTRPPASKPTNGWILSLSRICNLMAIFTQNSTKSDKMDIRANWLNFFRFF